jgi:CheY-like chemotaxis protein
MSLTDSSSLTRQPHFSVFE